MQWQLIHTPDNFLASCEFQTRLNMEARTKTTDESEWLHGNCLQSKCISSKDRNPEEKANSQG